MSLFDLTGHKTSVATEVVAGCTTFFAMVYIIFVNPNILSSAGMPWGGVFSATIIASAIAMILIGLYANVPFAMAPGMGLNAFFAFTLCLQMGFKWQEALAIYFIGGLLIAIMTLTNFRRTIIFAIPEFLKSAIGIGIGLFIAYIGMKNAGFLNFLLDANTAVPNGDVVVPSLAAFNNTGSLLGLIGLVITVVLIILRVKGGIFIGIIITTLIGIPMGLVDISDIKLFDISSVGQISQVAFAAFSTDGFGTLFGDASKTIVAICSILAVFLSATFDAIGTFVGTGRISGIFDDKDMETMKNKAKGPSSKFEKALLCDGLSSAFSSIVGTSTVTTYVESATGISAGGRTGLTSIVVAILFLMCLPFAGIFGIVPAQATAPALIVVGVFMMAPITKINWQDLEQAIPAFLTVAVMAFAYNISYGIAAGFIFYCVLKLVKGDLKEVHPILIAISILFLINFTVIAFNK
jgi:AGZA family xanthine/uracil permease-like MFS transporter